MTESILGQIGEQVDETARKTSRAASAIADAVEDGVSTVRRAAKRGTHVATELFDDTKRRLRRHPVETVALTFAAGIVAGAIISWLTSRRKL
jgi:ElaB/YqjD/DUF883 family membrane-anchored ribosome-binding protein